MELGHILQPRLHRRLTVALQKTRYHIRLHNGDVNRLKSQQIIDILNRASSNNRKDPEFPAAIEAPRNVASDPKPGTVYVSGNDADGAYAPRRPRALRLGRLPGLILRNCSWHLEKERYEAYYKKPEHNHNSSRSWPGP